MARKKAAGERRKKVLVQLIPEKHAGKKPEPYRVMEKIKKEHHPDLHDAKIAMAWRLEKKADADGHLWLGQAKKGSDLDRAMHGFDFVILLNKEVWSVFSSEQKEALVDHELCHCAISCDTDGDPKLDDQGRKVWRIRRHDLEEFKEVYERHGAWKSDIRDFVAARIEADSQPLLKVAEAS